MTNLQTGTNIEEIADNIYRINTPIPPSVIPGGFSFNQYLINDDEPLLFHTGPRKMFPLVREAVSNVIPVEMLRFIAFSHVESDECGSLNEWLAVSPRARPLCGRIAAIVSIQDLADRPPHVLTDGEMLKLGRHSVKWLDMPHMPHAWECGYLMELNTKTLLCGDLFTQPGDGQKAITESDILGPSESFRQKMDYYSHTKNAIGLLSKLASEKPVRLACMHGSAWEGDGARLLLELSNALSK